MVQEYGPVIHAWEILLWLLLMDPQNERNDQGDHYEYLAHS
jgi:hypothetical protein